MLPKPSRIELAQELPLEPIPMPTIGGIVKSKILQDLL
jgi:hypothetical protein